MLTVNLIEQHSRGLDIIKVLFKEYVTELNENLEFQHYDEELEDPLKKYGPPAGSLELAYYNGEVAGCVALQFLDEGICEMKRLYVTPDCREHGVGDELVRVILSDAKERGYSKMVLDTLERLRPAIRLYEKHGFVTCAPYYNNPLPNVVFMEKEI